MNEVICEVMGTYNGLCIAKGTNDAADFLRLAVEFEISGIRDVRLKDFKIIYPLFLFFSNGITSSFFDDGGWGSWPHLIGNCLDAYQISYEEYTCPYSMGNSLMYVQFEKELMNSSAKCGILSMNDIFKIHTYAIDFNGLFNSYNNYSSINTAARDLSLLDTLRGWNYYYGCILY